MKILYLYVLFSHLIKAFFTSPSDDVNNVHDRKELHRPDAHAQFERRDKDMETACR